MLGIAIIWYGYNPAICRCKGSITSDESGMVGVCWIKMALCIQGPGPVVDGSASVVGAMIIVLLQGRPAPDPLKRAVSIRLDLGKG